VIPALQPSSSELPPAAVLTPPPPPEREPDREREPVTAAGNEEKVVAAPPAPPAPVPPPAAPARGPIRLDREIPAPPAAAVQPAATPLPLTAAVTPEPEVPMPEGAAWTGEALRRVREARGLTVQQIADRTKVTRHHVENIEAERFPALPAPVYLRGILLSLARELRLDGQKVARAYLDRAAAQGGKR
jgi:hypothetical protein